MDQRKDELKRLKKAYRRKKRSGVSIWRTLAVVFFLIAILGTVLAFTPVLPVLMLLGLLPGWAITFLATYFWVLYAVCGGGAALFVLFAILAACGKKKLQRSKEFLDYRTLKTTLKAEKEG